jgi:glucose dehydrogenase
VNVLEVIRVGVLLVAFVGTMACRSGQRPAADDQSAASGSPPTGGQLSASSEITGEWIMAPGDYANTRFSTLTDINSANVGRLREAWSFSTGTLGGHEAAPLIIGQTMYIVTPFPNRVYALDLSRPGAAVKWQ